MNLQSEIKEMITHIAWEKIGICHHHGINIPLFSIHTKKSCGIGEYYDLFPLIDWCNELGMDILQLLPLNESGYDPSPYNALSSCALHPIYLSLHALPYLGEMKHKLTPLHLLNGEKRVNYSLVYREKIAFLKAYLKQAKEKLKKETAYEDFIQKESWLSPYALFRSLKDRYHNMHWKDWPENIRSPSSTQLKKLYQQFQAPMEFYYLIQYLCFNQMKEVKSHAEKKGVFLKGDIPILVSPDSADVWHHPTFFDFNYVAGSPPTHFDSEGQYWGFPLYNWKAMGEDHYEWWKKRLLTAKKLYHLYRIDHVIGFFRLWAIPPNQSPSTGSFIPNDLPSMRSQGRYILEVLAKLTDMLPIGEDLGDVPPFISTCLRKLGIPGTKIFRWQRDQEGSFIPYDQYDPISMSSVSTHDLDPVPLWWQKNRAESRAYAKLKHWSYEEKLSPDRQFEILRDNHHSSSLFHINLLQEYLALTPHLTWKNLEDERINYPGTIQPRNWSYRYKLPLETLRSERELNEKIKQILGKRP